MAAITDKFQQGSGSGRPVVTSLAVTKNAGDNSAQLNSASGWSTNTAIPVTIFIKDTNGEIVQGTQTDWTAVLIGNNLTSMVLRAGVEPISGYPGNSLTVVKCGPTAAWADDLVNGLLVGHNQDGSFKTSAVQNALGLTNLNGYTPLGQTPDQVTYLGNRSYEMRFPNTDLTAIVSNGMRIRTTRTVAAPTQCTSLNGTSQYYSKTSPSGMTFTDDFAAGAWVKLSSYGNGGVISRMNGTSGWSLIVASTGQVLISGYNAGASNFRRGRSYQSIPLNKWVHIAGTLDMSGSGSTILIDGVAVPTEFLTSGTSPTSLVQAGNLEVGTENASLFFPGKIAQAFVTSSLPTVTQLRSIYSQGITSADITALNIVSAYSFNNSINDLNTTNANNLTANGGAVATNADSPFTQDDTGTPRGTDDYGIVTKKVSSTNTTLTVQVPEGCTIPTSGGVSAVVYSSNKAPFSFPAEQERWQVLLVGRGSSNVATALFTYQNLNTLLVVPTGRWNVRLETNVAQNSSSAGENNSYTGMALTPATAPLTGARYKSNTSTAGVVVNPVNKSMPLTAVSPTTVYFATAALGGAGTVTIGWDSDLTMTADNSYL